ncbi:hypothetical protein SEVIR_2G215100v4 [Setaria viridis]|uniref:Uncharacterized protein n=1 Tax=Setaria viridis TaxID=4556 RepID=A0A4U6VVR4_SETVI|nr:hypothetical protein SEVIR_2G215100v2 [Setaria viridis]
MRSLCNGVWFLYLSLLCSLSLSLALRVEFLLLLLGTLQRWWTMGWGGALDMAVVWLTEESEHAAARLHLCETQLLLRAHFSVCQLSLLLGTCSAASNSPSHSHPSLRTVASSCSCCRVLSSIAVAVAALFVLRLPAGRPAWPCPHLKPYLVSCSYSDGLPFGIRYS